MTDIERLLRETLDLAEGYANSREEQLTGIAKHCTGEEEETRIELLEQVRADQERLREIKEALT